MAASRPMPVDAPMTTTTCSVSCLPRRLAICEPAPGPSTDGRTLEPPKRPAAAKRMG